MSYPFATVEQSVQEGVHKRWMERWDRYSNNFSRLSSRASKDQLNGKPWRRMKYWLSQIRRAQHRAKITWE